MSFTALDDYLTVTREKSAPDTDHLSVFTSALQQARPDLKGRRLLDLGCGTGRIGISALLHGQAKSVTFADRTWEWLEDAMETVSEHVAHRHFDRTQVSYRVGDYRKMTPEFLGSHDWIFFFRTDELEELESAEQFLHWYGDLAGSSNVRIPTAMLLISSLPGKKALSSLLSDLRLSAVEASFRRILMPSGKDSLPLQLSAEEQEDRRLRLTLQGWTKTLSALIVSPASDFDPLTV
ncbi:MAG: class I SAM-dependent methyltransferase, partial [Verrucomicrobiales bacterium]